MNHSKAGFGQQIEQAKKDASSLPVPDAGEMSQSESLQQCMRDAIAGNQAPLGFEQFMQMSLYEPGLGYYTSSQRKFGQHGDFVTAPEVSPLFGRCLALFCQQVMASIENPVLVEFGAGSGRMAADILEQLEQLECLPEQYWIMELSAELQQRQMQTIEQSVPHLLERVQWLQQLPSQPFNGVILANELLDAMPVHRFVVEQGQPQQWFVNWSEQNKQWQTQIQPMQSDLLKQFEHIQKYLKVDFADGYESEISLAHSAWIKSAQQQMQQGVFLLIDYGYGRPEFYHPDRSMGTLMCHYKHRAHPDPFKMIGLQDITAYVDFTSVAEAALDCGMDMLGYTTQCGFLLECGMERLMPDPEVATATEMMQAAQQVKTLTLPSEMGERFKVMALGKNFKQPVPGFALMDQRGRL